MQPGSAPSMGAMVAEVRSSEASGSAAVRPRRPFVQQEHERSLPRPEAEGPREEAQSSEASAVIDMREKVSPPRRRSVVESVFWVVSCCFVLVYGDGKHHFLEATLTSPLVIRKPFYIACLCASINGCILAYLLLVVRLLLRDPRHFDHVAPGALSVLTLLGIMAYILFSVSLWPVFGAWIIPIIWCFFMGSVVLISLMPAVKDPNPKYLHQRAD